MIEIDRPFGQSAFRQAQMAPNSSQLNGSEEPLYPGGLLPSFAIGKVRAPASRPSLGLSGGSRAVNGRLAQGVTCTSVGVLRTDFRICLGSVSRPKLPAVSNTWSWAPLSWPRIQKTAPCSDIGRVISPEISCNTALTGGRNLRLGHWVQSNTARPA